MIEFEFTEENIIITGIIIILVLIFLYLNSNLEYIKGSDNNFHLVRDYQNKEQAAELLSEIKRRLSLLINHCINSHPDNPNVNQLKERFNPKNIQETNIKETGTSYTINKGQELHLCLRDKESMRLHHINILMFVAIHELAHVMSSSYGHNEEFGEHFVFLLNNATQIGIYSPVDYSKNPVKFCGMDVNDSPLF
jgi:hypothetical protein